MLHTVYISIKYSEIVCDYLALVLMRFDTNVEGSLAILYGSVEMLLI